MPTYLFERIARTPHSEQWRIETETATLGRVDVHFTGAKVYGTLVLTTAVTDEAIEDLIAEIDARIVSSADEYREDFVVSVWRGEEFGTYSEEDAAFDEFDDEDDLDDDEQ